MYINDTLNKALRDMLKESEYYFVLAELHCAYESGCRHGYLEGYDEGYDKGWKDGYDYRIKEGH